MRKVMLGASVVMFAFVLGRLSAQDIQPNCEMCPSTYVPAEELQEYIRVAEETGAVDQQVRSIDIGETNLQVAIAHRGKLDEPRSQSVAEHDLVTEVYYVLSGSGTNRTGPDLVDKQRRPPDNRAVRFLNGPGNNAAEMRNPATHELTQGDVFVDSCRDRAPVHGNRRPHHVPDDTRGPGQGGSAYGRSRVEGVPG